MNKKKYRKLLSVTVLSLSFCFIPIHIYGQNETNINLDSCLSWAKQNYPLTKQKGYLMDISENNISNLNNEWLPQVDLASKAYYQSEASIFVLGPAILDFPKDNYSFGLHVNQMLFDLGLNSEYKKVDRASTQSEVLRNEIELYKLNDKVLQLYGNILILKENIKIIDSYSDDLKSRHTNMTTFVNNGAMLQSNLDVLEVEMLKTSQRLIEANANLQVLLQTLSLLINKQIDGNTSIAEIPANLNVASNSIMRPELRFFESQQTLYDEKTKLVNRKSMPRLSAFGEGAYGTTGHDMLKTFMHMYGIIGVSLTMNFTDIYSNRYEKKNLQINKRMVDMQKDLFELNMNTSLIQENGEIVKIKDMIKMDSTIVNKRISISKTSANQLENGAITSADYLTYLNAEKQAVLSQRIHEIQLGIAIKNYNITTGIKF